MAMEPVIADGYVLDLPPTQQQWQMKVNSF